MKPLKLIEPDPERTQDAKEEHSKKGIGRGENLEDAHCPDRFVMCPPEFLSTRIKNNVWMKAGKINKERAMSQYRRIKNVVEALGTDVLEITPVPAAQDQVFCANVAVSIEPYVVLANYKAAGRDVEVAPARSFFRKHGYETIQPPYDFEGEAELKRIREDLYFGGYGQFTDMKALEWIADTCEIEIIPIKETNDKLYHLDCSILMVDEQNAIVVKEGIDAASFKAIESIVNVIVAPSDIAVTGCTNAVLIRNKNICLSGTFQPEWKEYAKAMEWMNATFDQFGYTCVFLDVDEFEPSGADLSCCIMHLTF
jgi:N-dimethylarginine dimethylaminohydrolase